MPPHLKCSLVCCSCTLHSTMRCTSVIQPATGTPYPQVSQVSGIDLPVWKTRITAFSEDYHGPAAPPRHTAVQVDLRVVIWWAGLAHRQLIHILQHCRHKCPKAQMSDFNRWLRSHNLHTHLAHLIPNQHTLTCRSINDLVLKQPANPHIEDILGSYPFLSPPWTSVLKISTTQLCAKLRPFSMSRSLQKSTYSDLNKWGKERQAHQEPSSLSVPGAGTYSRFNPSAAHHTFLLPSPFSFPSCNRKGALVAHISTVFARGVTKRVH